MNKMGLSLVSAAHDLKQKCGQLTVGDSFFTFFLVLRGPPPLLPEVIASVF